MTNYVFLFPFTFISPNVIANLKHLDLFFSKNLVEMPNVVEA